MPGQIAPIRWQVIYKDEDGKVIQEGAFSSTNPAEDLMTVDTGPTSVLDIIVHVTIKDIIETDSIKTEAEAEKAGADPTKVEIGAEDVNGKHKVHPYKIKRINSSVMVIRSKALIKALQAVVKYYPKQAVTGDEITVDEPYYFVLHHMKALEQYVDETDPVTLDTSSEMAGTSQGKTPDLAEGQDTNPPTNDLRRDFRVLKSFIDAKWEKKIERELERYKQNPPMATYEMLWMLFKPGTRVFAHHGDPLREGGWIVRSMKVGALGGANYYKMSLWAFDFNGIILTRWKWRILMYSYEGERKISFPTLDPCPMSITVADTTMPIDRPREEELVKKGKTFIDCIKTIFDKRSLEVIYDGSIVGPEKSNNNLNAVKYSGNAILDPLSYLSTSNAQTTKSIFYDSDSYEPGPFLDDRKPKLWDHYQNITAKSMKEYPPNFDYGHFILCPPTIGGFLTRRREFLRLKIENIKPLSTDPGILNTLQIDPINMRLITALTHRPNDARRSWSADNINNKGEGLIFLLHGPSGVGKTYTAECIAQYSGRPLLSLTVADLGTDENEMETGLAKWFGLSETWGAIMLIDEADVYFERRATNQLQRNSLVSAFLRSMEYYRGILFLTTNRLGHIDDAIISRIHLIIEYKDLTPNNRVTIWKQFFTKLTKDQPDYMVDDYLESFIKNDPKILSLKWNGREIRNAFQTAVALAEYDAKSANPPKTRVIVERSHVESVADVSAEFQKYMREFKGTADRRAFRDGARMDDSMRREKAQFDKARKAARENREKQ